MLPASFQIPAAVILLAGGLLSCFAGYRVFRVVLGIYGFILGALLASSAMGTDQTFWMVVAALLGGLIGALIHIAAYFVGVGAHGRLHREGGHSRRAGRGLHGPGGHRTAP